MFLHFLFILLINSILTRPIISSITTTPITSIISSKLPTVLMHGIISNKNNMNQLKDYLVKEFNINVIVPEIGNGIPNSWNLPLKQQGDMLCEQLNTIDELSNGFNFIGVSQGGILGRYYIEKCDGYKINNFITLVSPHGGVYKPLVGKIIEMYSDYSQLHYSFSSYWRDPFNYTYYQSIALLADLNSEVNNPCPSNRHKMNSINNFVMVYSSNDDIVTPPESSKFSTYMVNTMNVIPLELTVSYETLGLKELIDQNRLAIYKTNCTHDQHKDHSCFSSLHEMFKKYCNE